MVTNGSPAVAEVALTFDDGSCDSCVGGLVSDVETMPIHVTFCPNGMYPSWAHYAKRIRALIAAGKVAICNHTFDHPDLTTLSDAAIASELLRNETWIENTFGVSSRPYFRPPYGAYNPRVLTVAASIGFTTAVLWSASFADSKASTGVADEMTAIQMYARPGLIMLGHADFSATPEALPQVVAYLNSKGLRTVTLRELLG